MRNYSTVKDTQQQYALHPCGIKSLASGSQTAPGVLAKLEMTELADRQAVGLLWASVPLKGFLEFDHTRRLHYVTTLFTVVVVVSTTPL